MTKNGGNTPIVDLKNCVPALDGSKAKEPLDGSPLESVVQGREESSVPSNPAVPVTPDISIEVGDVIEFRLFSARVMAVNIEGYAMLRRTGAFPFVASMRELTDAQIISKRKRRKNTARSRDGE